MIKRVTTFIGKNLVNAMRDNIIIYGALFPILLAFVMGFFIPSVQSMKLTVAVEAEVGQEVINGLSQYGNVEIYESRELVQKRVEKNDDMAGIVKEGNEYAVLLEGNEAGEAGAIASSLMNMILSDEPKAQYEHVSLGKTNSLIREVSGALLLLTAILIGGYIVGFGIVDEKETKATHALSVTPLKMSEFVLSNTLLCLVSGIVLAIISTFILAKGTVNYWEVLLSIIATTGIGMILGFTIGAIADNLISAIAVVKFQMLIFIGIPIASLFVPQNLQWVFYIFPNYWAFQSYLNIFSGGGQPVGFVTSTVIAFVLGTALMLALTPMLKKRLKLR